ncbi:MAG: CDP-glucose 4,6-dehydratase [Bacteroidales bacterium]|jgi:CDP-glucose 4,6-dehydratase|nr:CDP-glucose 4,6-dehydratase [Bacteroidales bacterium]
MRNFSSYCDKKVFLTGHTGFKGSWLALWLTLLGAKVCGYSLPPNTEPSLFKILNLKDKIKNIEADIKDFGKLKKELNAFSPDIIFHLAAQPLVRLSYTEPNETYQTNVMGSLNILEAAYSCKSVKAFVNVTTDKCYENKEVKYRYKEDDPFGGYDIYSSSKACVEILSSSFRRSFLKDSYALATARAGNVIGGGDWSQDRLIPDCIKSINEDKPIEIRNSLSVRPWQHVLEPLSGYLKLGQLLLEKGQEYAQGFNFGPNEESVLKVSEVAQKVVDYYGKGKVIVSKKDDLHEAGLLMLNIEKAKKILNWEPAYFADEAIKKTVDWYKNFYTNNIDMLNFTISQIDEYEQAMRE